MTPVPMDLPIRPPEAAELARLIFEHAERKPLTDDLRNRLAERAARLGLETIRPYFGSLAREPIHHSTYYLAIDGQDGVPLLLHMAPPAAPTSAVFHRPLLIGRLAQTVINAIPFGPADHENIAKFAARIDPAFLPRPQGAQPAIAVSASLPASFEAFRAVLKRTGKNLAAARGVPLETAVWAAIRSGWREGWSAAVELKSGAPESLAEAVRRNPGFTHYAIDVPDLEAAARAHETIRQARAAAKITRPFDFELSLESSPAPTTAEDLRAALEFLKRRGHPAQLVAPRLAGLERLEELAAVACSLQCLLSVRGMAGDDAAALDAIARATAGRVHYRACGEADGPDRIELLASHLA